MLPEAITDTLAILILFAIRVAIPIAITLAFGYWLEKKLQPRSEAEDKPVVPVMQRARPIKGPVQLHCWDMKRCDSTCLAECAAYQHPKLPCWLAIQVAGGKVHENCFTCRLYKAEFVTA